MSEEQRAADYRTQQAARLQGRLALYALLSGSVTARAALRARWSSVIDRGLDYDVPSFDDLHPIGPETN